MLDARYWHFITAVPEMVIKREYGMNYALDEVVDTLNRDGVVTVEGVFTDSEMDQFRGHLRQTIDEASQVEMYKGRPTDKLLGRSNDTIWLLWDLYAVCEEGLKFTRHPAILAFLEAALGEPIVHASMGTMFDKVAGGDAAIGWHQDTFFILVPPEGKDINLDDYWHQFGHVNVRPNQMRFEEDYYKKTIIVRINVDPQTLQNGCMRVIPGSYLEGPMELKGGQDEYLATHEAEAIDCTAGQGSVTFYYPTTFHASSISTAPTGTHRCAAAHRVRAQNLKIPEWDWPSDWEPGCVPAMPESGFALNPFI